MCSTLIKNFKHIMLFTVAALVVLGCKPAGPPPDLIEGQRKVLNDAKALEGKMQQQAQERMKEPEEPQK